jgi:hypothetical protein
MFKVINNLYSFFTEFANYSKDLQKKPYTINFIKRNTKNEHIITIKLRNSNSIFKMNADELILEDKLLKKFIWSDIRTISYYAFIDITSPKYKILRLYFSSDDMGKIIIRKRGEIKAKKKFIKDIVNDENIINSIPSIDAIKLGFLYDKYIKKEFIENDIQMFDQPEFAGKKLANNDKTNTRYTLTEIIDNNNEYTVIIKHKNKSVELTPLFIVNDNEILESLNCEQIRMLCYYAFMDKHTPDYRLIDSFETICKKDNIKISKKKKYTESEKFNSLIINNDIINSISSKDALRLGSAANKKEGTPSNE